MEQLAFTGGSRQIVDSPRRRTPEAPPAVHASDDRHEQQDVLAYRGLLAFTLVLFFRPQDSLPFLAPLRLGDVTAVFALLALAAGRMSRGVPLFRLGFELSLVLAFGCVILGTAVFSVWPGGAIAVFTDLYSKVVLIFVLMVSTLTTRARLERFTDVVVLGTSYIAFRAVVDYARGVNLVEDGRVTGAVSGLFGNPNDMALNMVTFLPLAVALAVGRSRSFMRIVALAGIPAIAAAIVFSRSRGGLVGLVAMLLVLLYYVRRVRPDLAMMVLAVSLAAIPVLPSSFTNRMSSIFNADEDPTGSREARKQLLREGYQAFRENPVFGVGAGQFMNYSPDDREGAWRETHNAVLQVASELGLVGLVIFVLLVGSGFAAASRAGSALRRARQQPGARRLRGPDARGPSARGPTPQGTRRGSLELYAAALMAGLAGWVFAAMFASVAYYWTLYIVLGLAAAHRDITLREVRAVGDGSRARAA